MSSPALLISSGAHGSALSDALPYLGAVVGALATGLLAYFAARHTAAAQLQGAITDAFQALMKEWQDRHAADTARISELEGTLKFRDSEIVSMRGQIRQLEQKLASSERAVKRFERENEAKG